jgi:hypothetical protein
MRFCGYRHGAEGMGERDGLGPMKPVRNSQGGKVVQLHAEGPDGERERWLDQRMRRLYRDDGEAPMSEELKALMERMEGKEGKAKP